MVESKVGKRTLEGKVVSVSNVVAKAPTALPAVLKGPTKGKS